MGGIFKKALVVTTALAIGFGACGGDGETNASGTGTSDTSGSGQNTGGSTGVTLSTTGQGGETTVGVGSGGSSTGVGGGCAGESIEAELLPLDMYIMLDSSGSMTDKTGMMGNGVEKWEAITGALDAFFTAGESAGIGVALQFFPLRKAGVPESCSADSDCAPDGGACMLKVCDDTFASCDSNNDCGAGASCVNVGQCANDTSTLCLPAGQGLFCNGNKGECVNATTSFCEDAYTCDVGSYAAPEVAMDTLPSATTALNTAITAKSPEGATPTSAALDGAIEYASGWAQANPEHTVVAVLATDGTPTECDPLDADSIADIAAAGVALDPSVLTFVVGIVKGSENGAKQALNAIAAGGGTNKAFFVDPSGNVGTDFLDALNAIRSAALACEYLIPEPSGDEMINYSQVNVDYTPAGGNTKTIFFVPSEADCDADTGGWYYDVDPAEGTPEKILACPSTCDELKQGGKVDIVVGCDTIIAPPK